MRYEEKCGKTRQAADDNITRRMRVACRKTKATNTHLAARTHTTGPEYATKNRQRTQQAPLNHCV
jgi:hypothetical protein